MNPHAISDLALDTRNLAVLIALVTELAVDYPPERDQHRAHLDKIGSLLWIARDTAEKLAEDAEAAAAPQPSVRMVGGTRCAS